MNRKMLVIEKKSVLFLRVLVVLRKLLTVNRKKKTTREYISPFVFLN